jgi:hypothetical protein
MSTAETELVRELRETLGAEAVRSSSEEIVKLMQDESWLSPVLQREIERRNQEQGAQMGVQAVVRPTSEDDVVQMASIAAKHRVPMTPRGAGTSNFGLLSPEEGGLIIDFRGLTSDPEVTNGSVRAAAGTFQGKMERAAREKDRELPVLTTTYSVATIGGWLCGGHAGLGSSVHGAVWDHIVESVRVVSVEEKPRTLTFDGDANNPLLHTFGTVGLVTEVTLRTDPIHEWLEAVAFFPQFEQASKFVREITVAKYRVRVATAQEEGLMPGLRQLAPIMRPGAGVLMILDRTQAEEIGKIAKSHGGEMVEWQTWRATPGGKPSIAQMVYGHRMLWVKRYLPEAAFIHLYFDLEDPDKSVRTVKQRFGDEVLCEMKFFRSPWMLKALGYTKGELLPAALCVVRNGATPGKVDEILAFCDKEGIRYQNSHTNVIEENGLFPDVTEIVKMKSQLDPHNLLSRGRLRSAVTKP